MYRRVQYLAVALATVVLMFAGNAAATTITTLDFTTWSGSGYTTGAKTLVDLSTLSPGTNYGTAMGVTLSGFTFTGPDNSSWVLAAQSVVTGGSSHIGLLGGPGASINVAMPVAGNSAIFFDAITTPTSSFTLTLSDGESFAGLSGPFGVSISHSITSFLVTASPGAQPFLEYVYFGTSSLPPDPPAAEGATAVMIAGGLLIIFGRRRKLAKRREASRSDDESGALCPLDSPSLT